MKNKGVLLILGLSVAAHEAERASQAAVSPTEEQAYAIGVQAYIYAYPLVLMDVTRQVSVQRVPMNRFHHLDAFPTSAFKTIVRPNVDTLYSSAWLDLSREPIVLSVPDTGGRYYLVQMLDGWTETFAVPGKRTTGTKAGHFALVGPDWSGTLPRNVRKIKAPTNLVWIIGRTQTNGTSDYTNVHAIQRGYNLIPMSGWVGPEPPAARATVDPTVDMKTPPPAQVARMDAATFFKAFAALMQYNRPHPDDTRLVAELKTIGIERGKPFDITKLAPEVATGLQRAVQDALKKVAERARGLGTVRNGWRILLENIGRYGTAYLDRAAIALIGLGALPPEEAVYLGTGVDRDGKPLSGTNRYALHFDKRNLPPANAFWSVTLYDTAGYFTANPLDRYALGDRDKLKYNEDGSLDIYVQHDMPGKDKEWNWLPAPETDFSLAMRLYWPKPDVVTGKWTPPAVRHGP